MASVINTAVNWAVAIANDDTYRYVYGGWGRDDGGYDCGHFVITAYDKAGLGVIDAGATYTDNMRAAFLECGFEDITSEINLSTGSGLKKGDVLIRKKTASRDGHAALVQEDDGTTVEAMDSAHGIVANVAYRNAGWNYILRYSSNSGSASWVQKEVPTGADLSAKSYMGYQAITDTSTMNYKISHSSEAETTSGGLRKYRGYYCIAMGSYYGSPGTYVRITFDDGITIYCIISDQKKDSETDSRHMYHLHDKTVIEFLVDNSVINCSNTAIGNSQFTSALQAAGISRSAKITQIWTASSAGGSSSSSGSLDITSSVIKSIQGGKGSVRTNPLTDAATLGNDVELFIINHAGTILYPPVKKITLDTYRKDSPSKLSFEVPKLPMLNFHEGAQVVLKAYGVNMFYGYVFSKTRAKDGLISCTAYDQLRYFKNKDCYVYEEKTASELIRMIADDYNLVCGDIADTGYKIPLRVEDDNTLFDIVQTALDQTLINTGVMYVLYDDYGALTLSPVEDMIYNLVIDDETAEDYSYESTIDGNTVTSVKVYYDNDSTGEREIHIARNEELIDQWGVLQMCESIDSAYGGAVQAKILLNIYGVKERKLEIKNALGNPSVRGGCSVFVNLDLGDIVQKHFMLCESVKHTFENRTHMMDLSLVGGEFVE